MYQVFFPPVYMLHFRDLEISESCPINFPLMPGGHKITSASSLGGYGNAGAWGIVRCIDDDLDELLRRHGITEHRAADLLEEGTGEKWSPKLKPQRSKLTKLVN